jgi:hypothetical protein
MSSAIDAVPHSTASVVPARRAGRAVANVAPKNRLSAPTTWSVMIYANLVRIEQRKPWRQTTTWPAPNLSFADFCNKICHERTPAHHCKDVRQSLARAAT